MRYLVDLAVFVAVFIIGWRLFQSPGYGIIAGIILTGGWEGLQGKRAKG